jgi:Trk-type K+ transport system membrane component
MTEIDEPKEFMWWWAIFLATSATMIIARLFFMLGVMNYDPPLDPALYRHWARRRLWIALAELSALPAFATFSLVIVIYREVSPYLGVLIAMFLGGIGFLLLLDALQWLFRKRLGMPQAKPEFGGSDDTKRD